VGRRGRHTFIVLLIVVVLAFLVILLFLDLKTAATLGQTLKLGDKGLGGLVVHTRKCGDVGNEVVEETFIELRGAVCDEGLLCEDHSLGGLGISGQETPVDETTIPKI
jgi:hypothetical protein